MSKVRNLRHVVALAFFLFGAGLAPQATAGTSRVANAPTKSQLLKSLFPVDGARSDWFGVYMGGRKVGFARTWSRSATPDELGKGRRFIVGLEMTMKVFGSGALDTVKLKDVRSYGAIPPHRLIHATYVQRSSNVEDRRRYQAASGHATVQRFISGGHPKKVDVQVSREVLSDLAGLWSLASPTGGTAPIKQGYNFTWDRLQDRAYRAQRVGVTERMIAGLAVSVSEYEIHHDELAAKAHLSILNGGRVLSMGFGPQLRMELEEQAVAQGNVEGLNVATAGVSIDSRLPSPERLKEVHLTVSLPKGHRLAERGKRRASDCKGRVCKVRIRRATGPPVEAAERESALRVTHAIDHDVPAIRRAARGIVRGVPEAKRVEVLVRHVYKLLSKRLATNLPSASVVLRAGHGDCTEHTWLFVALARALGIAARPVYGLAYVEGDRPRFAYHAWAEVEVSGSWLEVDPTWGQAAADPGHIRLGLDSNSIAALFGGMAIKVTKTLE